tara:strand:+ start:294 stop:572 length:279 start_codon:yes stop_codon:yes gene_type:complete
MKRQIIYTFEFRGSQKESIKLICGDPWGFQDLESALSLFTNYLSNLWKKEIHRSCVKPYMAKGVLVTNKNTEYLQFSMMPDKIDLKEYIVLT